MKVAVLGGNGQLGTDVVRAFEEHGDESISLCHADVEVADAAAVRRTFEQLAPEVVVNTTAMHHVENCEIEPEKAYKINGLGARNIAAAARELSMTLIHVSTDYVFDGYKRTPYEETDCPRPLNVYGNTKLAGEYFIRCGLEKHFVVRTSGLYGKSPCRAKGGRNFVDLMLKLAKERGEVRVVNDEWVSPTSTRELARQIVALSLSEAYGLYHATAEGTCSWYEFAREIFAITNTTVSLKVAAASEFPAKVPRPKYSVLENHGLKLQGLNTLVTWQDGLREYLGASQLQEVAQSQ